MARTRYASKRLNSSFENDKSTSENSATKWPTPYDSVFLIPLPKWHFILYGTVVTLQTIIAYYLFFQTYKDLDKDSRTQGLFREGWFGRSEDISNGVMSEFNNTWRGIFTTSIIQVIVSRLSMKFLPQKWNPVLSTLVSLIALSYFLTIWITLFYLAIFLVCFTASYFHEYATHWLISIACLFHLRNIMTDQFTYLDREGISMYYYVFGYAICRIVSFGHVIGRDKRNSEGSVVDIDDFFKRHFLDSMHYLFYWHQLGGPIMTYVDFMKCVRDRPNHVIQWKRSIFRAFRLLSYYFLLRVFQHFIYMNALLRIQTEQSIYDLHCYTCIFICVMGLVIFTTMFMIIYGSAGLFSHLDGVELYDWPRCGLSIHSFRNAWRVWDVGLTKVVRDHIYIPLGGSKGGLRKHVLSTIVAFGFLFLYHGALIKSRVTLYLIMNCFQVLVEVLAEKYYNAYLRKYLTEKLHPFLLRKLIVFLGCWNGAIAGHTVFVYYLDYPYGMYLSKRSFDFYVIGSVNFLYVLYGCCVVMLHVDVTFAYEGYLLRQKLRKREEREKIQKSETKND